MSGSMMYAVELPVAGRGGKNGGGGQRSHVGLNQSGELDLWDRKRLALTNGVRKQEKKWC